MPAEVPLKKYSMKVGNSIDGSPFCEIGTVNLDAESDTACQHQNVLCPNGWSLIDYRENCWCDLCHERVILDRGRCDENCGCQQWMQAPKELYPVVLAMRASRGSSARYSPVQQDGDSEMNEGDLAQP